MHTQSFAPIVVSSQVISVRVEAGLGSGFSGIQMIGSDCARDSKERATSALEFLGWKVPQKRINLSLTPGNIKKTNGHMDLVFAVLLYQLTAKKEVVVPMNRVLFCGELSLKGDMLPVSDVVPILIEATRSDYDFLVVPQKNLDEVLSVFHKITGKLKIKIFAAESLQQVLHWIDSGCSNHFPDLALQKPESYAHPPAVDFDDVLLSEDTKKVLLTAVIGRHSLFLKGSPGTGKTMMAQRLPSLLPALEDDEQLSSLMLHSLKSKKISPSLLSGVPPFRAPHHSASSAAIIGTPNSPGEISLAHNGILFLDEMSEFRRDIVESLREPLETGEVQISRADKKKSWPGKCLLVAASNPCPCGWYNSKKRHCHCAMNRVLAYQAKISGPILQRLDLHFHVDEVDKETMSRLFNPKVGLGQTRRMLETVRSAVEFSKKRNHRFNCRYNSELKSGDLGQASGLSQVDLSLLLRKTIPSSFTNRNSVRLLRVARTQADIEQRLSLNSTDLNTALKWMPKADENEVI